MNKWLVTGDDCFVRLFRFSRETKKTTLKEEGVIGKHRWMVWNVQYSNDMQYIYSSGHDGSVRMWRLERVAHKVDKDTIPNYQLDDPEMYPVVKKLEKVHAHGVWDFKKSSNDSLLYTCGGDAHCKCWDFETSQLIRTFEGHKQTVFGIRLIFEKNLMISCSQDQTIRFWDLRFH
jgi:WD40 repeat protein